MEPELRPGNPDDCVRDPRAQTVDAQEIDEVSIVHAWAHARADDAASYHVGTPAEPPRVRLAHRGLQARKDMSGRLQEPPQSRQTAAVEEMACHN
mgnify:CR=1 FL=1